MAKHLLSILICEDKNPSKAQTGHIPVKPVGHNINKPLKTEDKEKILTLRKKKKTHHIPGSNDEMRGQMMPFRAASGKKAATGDTREGSSGEASLRGRKTRPRSGLRRPQSIYEFNVTLTRVPAGFPFNGGL